MKKNLIIGIIIVIAVVVAISIIANRQKAMQSEEIPFQEGIVVEDKASQPAVSQEVTPSTVPAQPSAPAVEATPAASETLVPPTPMEIQQALKNAGFYQSDVDGKIGPKTRQAIKEFQEKNGLKTDGVVGPRTWRELKKYLAAPAAAEGMVEN